MRFHFIHTSVTKRCSGNDLTLEEKRGILKENLYMQVNDILPKNEGTDVMCVYLGADCEEQQDSLDTHNEHEEKTIAEYFETAKQSIPDLKSENSVLLCPVSHLSKLFEFFESKGVFVHRYYKTLAPAM